MGISPGATDAGASCAVMLELASVLVSREQKLQYDVLLLFVDSEENGLVGSSNWVFGNNDSLDATFHVEPHPWSLLPALVINLEGSGIANGRKFSLVRIVKKSQSSMLPTPGLQGLHL